MRNNRKGQSILEYTVIFIIILGVMIAMKDYVKRGIQGRWKSATDDFGEQYDPTAVNSNVVFSTIVNSNSAVSVQDGTYQGVTGQFTNRWDTSDSVETKVGTTQVGN
jgi:Flp pilus assembly pilin Flp